MLINLKRSLFVTLLFYVLLLSTSNCIMAASNDRVVIEPVQGNMTDPEKKILVNENSFVCLKKMHPVRGFFVGNLLGQLDSTIAAANQPEGAFYPPGSIVQLIPTEVMFKHHKGWSEKTNDWEFFELIVSREGSKIKVDRKSVV